MPSKAAPGDVTTSLPVTIRSATAADMPAVEALRIQSWRQAYVGQVDQSYLDSLDPSKRIESWQQFIAKRDEPDRRFGIFIALQGDDLVGFLSYAPPDSPDGDIRIGALYLRQDVWAQGIGYKLFTRAMEAFREAGFTRPYLWVLDTNRRAIDAYRRWGGQIDESTPKEFQIGTQTLREYCVIFKA